MNRPRQIIEGEFISLLESLRPKPEVFGLFRRIVRDVWEEKQRDATAECAVFERQIKELRQKKERLFDAYYGKALSVTEFAERKEAIERELGDVQIKVNDNGLKENDIEGLLRFTETVFSRPAEFWQECPTDQKLRF